MVAPLLNCTTVEQLNVEGVKVSEIYRRMLVLHNKHRDLLSGWWSFVLW